MKENLSKIADSELEILKILWQVNGEMTMPDIRKKLETSTEWEASTIKTLLYRLCEKGIVKAEKRNVYYYTSSISEQQYNHYATERLVDKVFNGNVKNLVASLIDSKKLKDSDIKELRDMFKVGE